MNILLQKPIVSEKSMKMAKEGLYTFMVDRRSRKEEIARAVKSQFGVDVLAVMTANIKGETRQQRGRRNFYKVSGYKKALVQLKNGQKIVYFESEKTEEEALPEKEAKEKKSLLKGTKVRIEKTEKKKEEK